MIRDSISCVNSTVSSDFRSLGWQWYFKHVCDISRWLLIFL